MKLVSVFFVMSLSAVCLAYSEADFNRDGIVDFSDFDVLANDWLVEDMNKDEEVVRDNLHSSIKGIRGLADPIPLKILAHMDDAENWDTSSANIEFDATKSINGIQSLKITSPSDTVVQTGWVDFPPDTYGGKSTITGCIGIWLYTDSNCIDVETIEVQFLPDKGSTSDYYRAILVDSTWPKWSYVKDDWWLIMLNPLRFGKAGSVAS